MKVNLTLDDINILVYRYLLENGYTHSAFTFSNEANIARNPYYSTHSEKMPTNALISFIQKAMIYVYIEYHTDESTGNRVPCDESFSLFRKHNCFRKVGSNTGFPSENDDKTNDIDMDVRPDPYVIPYDSLASHIYIGPPHRRFQDKWLLSGYYTLYAPDNTYSALTLWNPSIETHLLTVSIGGPSFISFEMNNNKGFDYKLLSFASFSPEKLSLNASNDFSTKDAANNSINATNSINANNEKAIDEKAIDEKASNERKNANNPTIGCIRYDGNVIATGYEDGRCCIWSNEANLLDTLRPFESPVTAMAFSGNLLNPEMNDDQTERLCVAGLSGSLCIYELASDGSFKSVNTTVFPHSIIHIAWRDHTILSIVANDLENNVSCVSLYNSITCATTNITPLVENSGEIIENTSKNVFIKTIWDREGTSLAIVGDVLHVYHYNTNAMDRFDHRDKVIDADWVYGFGEKASKRLVTCSADKLVTLWDITNKTIINTAVLDHIPTCLALSKNSAVLAVATFGAILKVFALPGLILKFSIQESKLITNISWSADTNSLCYNLYKSSGTVVLPLRIFTQYE